MNRSELIEPGPRIDVSLRVRTVDIETARRSIKGFAATDPGSKDRERLLRSAVEQETITPSRDTTHTNATVYALHTYLAKLLSAQSLTALRAAFDPVDRIALGRTWSATDGNTPDQDYFNITDTELNDKAGEIALSDPIAIDRSWTAQEQIGSLELSDETLREWGIISQDGVLRNHGIINPPIERTSSEATLLDLALPIGDASEVVGGELSR